MMMLRPLIASVVTFVAFTKVAAQQCQSKNDPQDDNNLSHANHTRIFRMGMLDIRGTAYQTHRTLWEDYLQATVGKEFENDDEATSVVFEMIPVAFQANESIYDTIARANLDFMFTQIALFTCLAVESEIVPLATVINQRKIAGVTYQVSNFAGLIITKADRDDIQSIADLRNKSTGCVSINGFGSGLMQFQQLIQAGIHYLQDVRQLVFFNKQPNVVNAVLQGQIDAGYIRTDQLERTTDASTGEIVDQSLLKILEPVPDSDYPFAHTTPLYPDFTLGVFPHVPNTVARRVKEALIRIADYAAPAADWEACVDDCTTTNETFAPVDGGASPMCHGMCTAQLDDDWQSCETTPELALLATATMTQGKLAGFTEPPSFMGIRTMLEQTGLLQQSSSGGAPQCIRSTNVAQAVTCPAGYIKRRTASIYNGCQQAGVDCFGFDCLCSPCVQAPPVEFYSVLEAPTNDKDGALSNNEDHPLEVDEAGVGCGKFAVCGQVAQFGSISFRVLDHQAAQQDGNRHHNWTVHFVTSEGTVVHTMTPILNEDGLSLFGLTYEDTGSRTGDVILQVYNGQTNEQIETSPFRLRVVQRDCAAATNDPRRMPDDLGRCHLCSGQSVLLGEKCLPYYILLPSFMIPLGVILGIAVYWYLDAKRKQMDLIWKVKPEELTYKDRVLGRGTFGMVLLAEYRGTQVAVKRALPPDERKQQQRSGRQQHSSTAQRFDFIDGTKSRLSQEGRRSSDPESGLPDDFGAKSVLPGMKSFAIGLSSSSSVKKNAHSSGIRSKPSPSNKSGSKSRLFKSSDSKQYERLKEEFKCEMRMLSKVRHPCITTVMGAVLDKTSEPLMIMEYMEMGSLYDLLHNDSMVLEGDTLLPILQDIARGIRFLHAAKPQIIHGDLKAANVLVDSRFRAKVADFGLSTKRNYHNAAVGTPFWMAPELLRKESPNSAQSDVYSFGVVLWEVLTRKNPYEGESHREVLLNVADRQIQKRPAIAKSCPHVFARLLQDCWHESPWGRPTAEALDGRLKLIDTTEVFSMSGCDNPKTTTNRRRGSHAPTRDGGASGSNWDSFPHRIAEALQRGERVEPETIDSVTVFFAEIVGLTEWSKALSSETLLDMLNRLHLKLDALCEQYGVLRVDTIGDVYMVVANANLDQTDYHADTMARFAVKVLEQACETLLDPTNSLLGHVPLRAGMHVGPVATHVLGLRHPKFSIVGETVSTAALMARRSQPGRVQCSDEASQVLSTHRRNSPSSRKMEYVIKPRGDINVKGQKMATHWVQSLFFRGSHHLAAVSEEHGLLDTDSTSEGSNDGVRVSLRETEHTEDLTGRSTLTNGSSEELSNSGRWSRREVLAPVYDYLKTIPQSP